MQLSATYLATNNITLLMRRQPYLIPPPLGLSCRSPLLKGLSVPIPRNSLMIRYFHSNRSYSKTNR
jgi:hypothetical protein